MNSNVQIEDYSQRTKIVIFRRVKKILLAIYSIAFLFWLAMLTVVAMYLFRGQSLGFVHAVILIMWAGIWLIFGRFLWNRWQHEAASREILFFERGQLNIRRPVSLFGITTVYDSAFMGPFYFSERHGCPAFDYAYHHVYFGQDLDNSEADKLIKELNSRFFSEDSTELNLDALVNRGSPGEYNS
jgi:hypothetical protein